MPNYGGESSGPSDRGGGNYGGGSEQEGSPSEASVLTGFSKMVNEITNFLGNVASGVVDTVKDVVTEAGPELAKNVVGKVVNVGIEAIATPFEVIDELTGMDTVGKLKDTVARNTWGVVSGIGASIAGMFQPTAFDPSTMHKIAREPGLYTMTSPFSMTVDWSGRRQMGYDKQFAWESMPKAHSHRKRSKGAASDARLAPKKGRQRSYYSLRAYGRRPASVELNNHTAIYR